VERYHKDYSYIRRCTGVFIYLFPFMGDVVRGCMRAVDRSIVHPLVFFATPMATRFARVRGQASTTRNSRPKQAQTGKANRQKRHLTPRTTLDTVSSVDSAHYRCPYASSGIPDICPEMKINVDGYH
jgi:hypothetical protein